MLEEDVKRRALLAASVGLVSSSAYGEVGMWDIANSFAGAYREWADRRNAAPRDRDTISASEVLVWQKVKSAWRRLEKSVDSEYRGER